MAIQLKSIDSCFPSDSCKQVDATYYIDTHPLPPEGRALDVVDLGAGNGGSVDLFRRRFPSLNWIGVDIEASPEVNRRTRTDCEFRAYNGVDLPFDENSIDLVYSRQVFEHVRYPEPLLKDIARVLKPGGLFVGSVSQLEPYHSYSLWNFTYYGFAALANDAGLTLREFRPGIDGPSLIARNIMKFHLRWPVDAFRTWFTSDSPINRWLELQFSKQTPRELNKLKVGLAGHLCFKFEKVNSNL
jgi:SAM-dependent methyltransferase